MSKPELPGKSLDDILASIRETLNDDRPEDSLSKLNNLVRAVKNEAAAQANGHAAKGADALPNRLADALGGAANGHASTSLTDLLSAETPSETEAPKPEDGEDMPWFLQRESQAAEPETKPAATKPAEASTHAGPSLPSAPEEIALTRPETLRRSFPPLFGAGETLPPRQTDMPAPSRPSDVLLTPKAAREPVAEPAKPAAPVEAKPRPAEPAAAAVEKPTVLPEPPVTVAAVASAREVPTLEPSVPQRADPVASVWSEPELPEPLMSEPPLPEPHLPEPPMPEHRMPEPRMQEPRMQERPRREAPRAEPAQGSMAAAQNQALQEMIARLLEPVIQQWLETNLPSMVETAIREEMSRQFKRARGELKI